MTRQKGRPKKLINRLGNKASEAAIAQALKIREESISEARKLREQMVAQAWALYSKIIR